MTQIDVAAMFDLKAKQSISAWESGTNMPSAEQVAMMAVEFGVSVEWLLTGQHPLPFDADTLVKLRQLDPSMRAQPLHKTQPFCWQPWKDNARLGPA